MSQRFTNKMAENISIQLELCKGKVVWKSFVHNSTLLKMYITAISHSTARAYSHRIPITNNLKSQGYNNSKQLVITSVIDNSRPNSTHFQLMTCINGNLRMNWKGKKKAAHESNPHISCGSIWHFFIGARVKNFHRHVTIYFYEGRHTKFTRWLVKMDIFLSKYRCLRNKMN